MPVPATHAVSGLLRSGAGRSGWPILEGSVVPLFAQSRIARSGATRSGYHSSSLFVSLAGHQIATRRETAGGVLLESVSITDILAAAPNTAQMEVVGVVPRNGDAVVMTLGSIHNLSRQFAGTVLQTDQADVADPETSQAHAQKYALSLIDPTWGLNKLKVRARYTSTTVAAVATSLINNYTAGYTLAVAADVGAVAIDEITFTEQDETDCLSQLMDRAGGDWRCDYNSVVRLFFEDRSETPPVILNAVHRSLKELRIHRDLSQAVTRVRAEGGGTNALQDVGVTETIVPVQNTSWYPAPSVVVDGAYTVTSGIAVSGPQRLHYTGVQAGGGGGLVGPGAAPSAALVLALASGAGVDTGAHQYAATYITAAGESLPSPLAAITVGVVDPPATPMSASAPTIGAGPNPGIHSYALTFVTSSGETTAGPLVTLATTLTPDPTTAPTPGTPTAGGAVDAAGTHEYAVTFVTSVGETVPGPIAAPVTVGQTPAPTTAPAAQTPTQGSGPDDGSHDYEVTFVTAAGETTPGTVSNQVTTGPGTNPGISDPSVGVQCVANGGGPLTPGLYRYAYTWVTAHGETLPSPLAFATVPPGQGVVFVGNNNSLPSGPATTIARNIYRTVVNGTQLKFVGTVADNTSTFYGNDSLADGSLGANAPTSNSTPFTAAFNVVQLLSIPLGGANVTGRKLYRRFNGSGTFKLVATIANNSQTSYSDTTANTSLGAAAPATNTAYLQTIPLTAIPLGNADVTSRKLYRRSGGAGLKLLATIADNVTTTYSDTTANASLGAAPPGSSTAYLQRIPLTNIPLPPTGLITSRKLYGTAAGGSQLKLIATLNLTDTSYLVATTDAGLGANAPSSNTATANQVGVSSVPVGPAAVTSRWIYRTAAGGTQLKRLHQLADNTTTVWADSAADSSLGANVPVSDTSNLTQPAGQVLAGSTSLLMTGTGGMSATGGWAIIGNGTQVVRYTGTTATALTGIPASGVGSITASIGYNSNVTAAPALTGVTGLAYAIKLGDPVNLVVQVDDLAAQAAMAALIGGTGVQEYAMADNRLSAVESIARAEAWLALKSTEAVGISFASRDLNAASGRLQDTNLGVVGLSGSYLIQRVTISKFMATAMPTRRVVASSEHLTFAELFRRVSALATTKGLGS
ncbi:MAG: hypothetical protein V4597_08545 [Pseudomonadota bacterium]